jgi:Domain of unknown function (DUF6484)
MKTVECNSLPLESAGSYLSVLELDVHDADGERRRLELVPGVSPAAPATIVGRLAALTDDGVPLVDFSGNDVAEGVAARTTVALQPSQVGSEVVLCFATGDRRQPIILGCLIAPLAAPSEAAAPAHVELNGKRLELTAQDEIVLRCGKASITLTQAGKVLIRGDYLLSRSSGVNRIKGGSVQIN